MQPPDATFDPARLAALASHAILDTPAEPGFDDIVQLAAQICEAPVALVSLVAADRQWFKARIGFEPRETDLNSSVCAFALVEPGMLVIPDLTQDPRTRDNPLVTGEPHIRFYAGAPFRAATGEVLGSLCVIDSQPRPGGLTAPQQSALQNLARQVTTQLSLRRAILERDTLASSQAQDAIRRNALMHLGDQLRELTTVQDMTRSAAAIVGQTLGATRAAFGYLEPRGEHIVIEPGWTADGIASIAGHHRFDDYGQIRQELEQGSPIVITDVASDPRTAARAATLLHLGIRSLVNIPLREHGRTVAVFIVQDRLPRTWSPEVLTFLGHVTDRLEAGIARLKAEAEQKTLNYELEHRLKNTFAMIQAMATQTLRAVPDQAPVDAFMQRLHALSAAHDVLIQQKWSSATIGTLVGAVAGAGADATRFDVTGPDVELGRSASLSVSLLLHELMTNAVKYGALSSDTGRVSVTWRLDNANEEPRLVLLWRESGGPPVRPPSRTGFGSKLIRAGLAGTGGVDLRYQPAGFEAEFKAPLAQVKRT